MYCSISGAVPEEPVVSKVSGHLFERRLLEKSVADTGVDPVTKSPMNLPEDAVVVRSSASASLAPKPRPSPANSVPGLIGLFRDEWDALALETHQLRASLHQARQELAHALYQHDAALRVIARLVRERDAARDAYEARGGGGRGEASASGAAAAPDREEEPKQKKAKTTGPAAQLPQDVAAAITSLSEELSKARKKRSAPEGCATAEAAKGFVLLDGSTHALHSARHPGVACVATAPSARGASSTTSRLVATGGNDGDVCIFDAASGTVRAKFAHRRSPAGAAPSSGRAVTDVAFVRGALLASAGADGAVRLWRPTRGEGDDAFLDADDADAAASATSWSCAAEVADAASPSSAVVAVAVHPSGDYFAAAGADGEWRLFDVGAARGGAAASSSSSTPPPTLARLASVPDAASGGYLSASFHPDGVILGVGTASGAVRLWDARTAKAVAKLEGHSPRPDASGASGGVAGVSFSENGYYLATGAADGVKAWDLRKLKSLASVAGPGGAGAGGVGGAGGAGGVSRLSFDPSGYLLAVAGPGGVSVLGSKQQWSPLCEFASPADGAGRNGAGALSVAWSSRGDELFAGGVDNAIRAYGSAPPA